MLTALIAAIRIRRNDAAYTRMIAAAEIWEAKMKKTATDPK